MADKVMQGGKAQFYEFLREAIRSDAELRLTSATCNQ